MSGSMGQQVVVTGSATLSTADPAGAMEDLSAAAAVDYRTCREELGMTHEEAVEQVIEQASESYECLAGECMH